MSRSSMEGDARPPAYNESMANDPPAPEYPGGDDVYNSHVESDGGEASLINVNVEGGDAPPSYTSLFGQIKDAKQNSEGNLDFFKVLIGILLGSVIGLVLIAISGALPIAQLVIGVQHKDDCPIQPRIPIWLMASGACGICQVVLSMFKSIVTRKNNDGSESGGGCCQVLLNLLHIGATGLFIAGNVWVYKIKDTVSYDPTNTTNVTSLLSNGTDVDSLYCDKTCYLFAFWSITAAYIGLGVLLVICCLACLCLCVVAGSSN